ncbi:hypothetical protein [Marinomonas sp. ef1]|nr:hypothetical protein [Marinomonas sp. ef1]
MKASLLTADYGRASLITPYERAASPMKSVRRNPDCATLWSFRVS